MTEEHTIKGKVYVLGDNIDTDQIIPAQYLNLVYTRPDERVKMGSYAMAGLPDDCPAFVEDGKTQSEFTVIVAGKNFGCGSSREHAPVALGAAGIQAVVAESYARIFFRNSISTGELLPCESKQRLVDSFKNGDEIEVDVATARATHVESGEVFELSPLGPVAPVVAAGGIFEYARQSGMMPQGGSTEGDDEPTTADPAATETISRTRIIAFANQKGGVGKTTSAVNLAACVAKSGKKVLLVDIDPQCNTTSGLGIESKQGGSIYASLLEGGSVLDMAIPTGIKNLDIVPSEVDLAGAEVDVAREERYLRRLRAGFATALKEETYDYIFIDCPPSLGILTMNALVAAHAIIIPIQCEYYALEGLSVISSLLEEIRSSGANSQLELQGILMTMYDGRTKLSSQVVEEVRRHFEDKVYKTIIPRNVRLSEAPSHGLPIVEYDRFSSGAKSYKKFAKEFLKREEARSQ
jgi:chromosome partitioning protein